MKHPQTWSRLCANPPQTLCFAPLAWLKLQWFCHQGETEVGGFGLTAEHHPLYVEDFVTVRQAVTPGSVRFDDQAVADFFDACVDRGLALERFARIWVHTHPGASPQPSGTDEETFARSFGSCDWSVMFIVSRTARTYAGLAFAAGPGGQLPLDVTVHWASLQNDLARAGHLDAQVNQWRREYDANIQLAPPPVHLPALELGVPLYGHAGWWDVEPWDEELDGVCYDPTYRGDVDERFF